MSKKNKKSEILQPSSVVSNFINKHSKKLSENDSDDANNSLNLFKSVQPSSSSSSSLNQPNTAISSFINKPSTSSSLMGVKRNVKKKNSQVDIRKAWTKKDQKLQKALDESFSKSGLDPFEVQLALALSESLKDQKNTNEEEKKNIENENKFENPFQKSKATSVTTLLEHYGFKSKRVLSDFEQEMVTSNKSNKRSKFKKFPTLLTQTTREDRQKMINKRIQSILDEELMEISYEKDALINYNVFSSYLQQFHIQLSTIKELDSSEESSDKMMFNYYITDLFEPSYVRPDYLLKDWNQIPGRDRSPCKNIDKVTPNESTEDDKKSNSSSLSDIFAGIESFDIPNELSFDESGVNEQLSVLKEKLSQEDSDESTIDYDVDEDKKINIISSSDEENIVDLTQQCNDNLTSKDSIEIIDISDDEINYSIKMHENLSPEKESDNSNVMEIDNLNDESSNDQFIISFNYDDGVKMRNNVSNFLEATNLSMMTKEPPHHNGESFKKFMADEGLSESISNIINKYHVPTPKRSFQKMPSESSFGGYVPQSSIIMEEGQQDYLDDNFLNKSIANIINSPLPTSSSTKKHFEKRKSVRKSISTLVREKYEIDIENRVTEPDFNNMTPDELKKELFKYGIRSLPTKKAIGLLQHIFNSTHPKIRVAISEEIDENDSRMVLNHTDIVTDIVWKGEDDDFVFHYAELEGEEYILPKTKKSKVNFFYFSFIYLLIIVLYLLDSNMFSSSSNCLL